MPRIFIPPTAVKEGRVSITGEKARYLTSVLRFKKGDELIVFDGEGNCFRTKILKADRREVTVEVLEKFPYDTESPLSIILVQGLLKGEKMDLVIQKATELGVKEIQPVITERSQVRETRKVTRWRKIAEEASRQAGRTKVPVIHEALVFKNFLTEPEKLKRGQGGLKGFIFWEEGGVSLKEAVQKISPSPLPSFTHSPLYLLIGPEGGFTGDEIALAETEGLIVVSLGKRILRAETASLSAVALVQFLLGDLG